MQEYPKWKYHRTLPARTVNDPEQEAALGDGWADTPAVFAEGQKGLRTAGKRQPSQ
jgi:hypothetical protein